MTRGFPLTADDGRDDFLKMAYVLRTFLRCQTNHGRKQETCDRVILKFEAKVQTYVAVSNIGCEIQNSGGNVVSFSKINSYEISF